GDGVESATREHILTPLDKVSSPQCPGQNSPSNPASHPAPAISPHPVSCSLGTLGSLHPPGGIFRGGGGGGGGIRGESVGVGIGVGSSGRSGKFACGGRSVGVSMAGSIGFWFSLSSSARVKIGATRTSAARKNQNLPFILIPYYSAGRSAVISVTSAVGSWVGSLFCTISRDSPGCSSMTGWVSAWRSAF